MKNSPQLLSRARRRILDLMQQYILDRRNWVDAASVRQLQRSNTYLEEFSGALERGTVSRQRVKSEFRKLQLEKLLTATRDPCADLKEEIQSAKKIVDDLKSDLKVGRPNFATKASMALFGSLLVARNSRPLLNRFHMFLNEGGELDSEILKWSGNNSIILSRAFSASQTKGTEPSLRKRESKISKKNPLKGMKRMLLPYPIPIGKGENIDRVSWATRMRRDLKISICGKHKTSSIPNLKLEEACKWIVLAPDYQFDQLKGIGHFGTKNTSALELVEWIELQCLSTK